MRTRLLFVFFVLGLCTTSTFARDRMYCYQRVIEGGATGGGKVQVNGFTVEVKPIADPNAADYMTCHATITSPQGKIVFEESDWGIEIDAATGKDLNGDDQPDAVLVGFSGGAHCCWTYQIISLGKAPGLIRKFENRSTATFEDLNGNGQVEISFEMEDSTGALVLTTPPLSFHS